MKLTCKFFLFLALALLTFAQPATAQNTTVITQDQERLEADKYTLINNKSGDRFAGQVIWRYAQPGFWDWGTWFEKYSANSVNSPAAVLGWHWSTPRPETELPRRIWDVDSVFARAEWSIDGLNKPERSGAPNNNFDNRVFNVSYNMWFHEDSQISDGLDGNDNPRAQIAVWLHHQGGIQPPGSWQQNVNLEGREWELWRGRTGGQNGWDVFTYRPYAGQRSVNDTELRLATFIHDIVYFHDDWLSNNRYLTGVEFGPVVAFSYPTIFRSSGNFFINVTGNASTPAPAPAPAPTPTPQDRDTMYVEGRHLHAANGERVLLRGVNFGAGWVARSERRGHIEEIAKTGANCVRIVWVMDNVPEDNFFPSTIPDNFHTTSVNELDEVIGLCIENKMIPMVMAAFSAGEPLFSQIMEDRLAYWLSPSVANVLKKHEKWLLFNPFNEAGVNNPGGDPNFQAFYERAINEIRDADINVPIVIDAPQFGQAYQQILNEWRAVRNSDEGLRNILFSIHTYFHGKSVVGGPAEIREIYDEIIDGVVSDNIPLIFGEGPSPTDYRCLASPWEYALNRMQDNQISWLAWSWGASRNEDCRGNGPNQFDLTTESRRFGVWNSFYASQLMENHPNSIKNTSVRPIQ